MKSHLATFLTFAAVVSALPAVASAATTPERMMVPEATVMSGPSVPAGTDDMIVIGNAEHAYLRQVCPTVLTHQGAHSPTLVRFCQDAKG